MANCQIYDDLEKQALDAELAEHQDAVNLIEDEIIGRIFPRDRKGRDLTNKKHSSAEAKRVKLLKEIRTMLLNKVEKNPQFANAFLKRILFTQKHARPGKMNDQALSTTIAIHKRLKQTLKNLDQTQDITQRVASAYTKAELKEYQNEWNEKGEVTQLPPKLGSPKSWFNWVLDKAIPKPQITSPHLLAFKGESTGWAAKIVLDSMFLQDSATILARPFRENIGSAYASLRSALEFHFGRTNTQDGVSRTNVYFGNMLDEDGEPLGDIDNDNSNSSREILSKNNLLDLLHNIMRGKTRLIKPMELAVADDETRKVILDMATRKIVRYKGTDGVIRTLSGNVFTYRNSEGKVDDNYIFFKFLKKGEDGKRKVIRLKTENLIPVDGKTIQDAGYTTAIEDENGNEQKYVMVKKYDGDIEYFEAYLLGFRVEIDKNGDEITTNEPALNEDLNVKLEREGFNPLDPSGKKEFMFMEAETDAHSMSENVYESFGSDGKMKDHRKKRFWNHFRPMSLNREFFNHGTYYDDNGDIQTQEMDTSQQMRALTDLLFRPKEIVDNDAETPKAGVFSTVRELRHILSGKLKDNPNDNFDNDTAGFGYNLLQQIQDMQKDLDVKLTKNFKKAKHHLMKQGMNEEQVYDYLLGLEDMGGYNPYQNLSVNIQVDVNDNVHTPNSYLGRDNMYFPDIYEDVVYRERLNDSIQKTKMAIMNMLNQDTSTETDNLLQAIDDLDSQDSKKEGLLKLREDLQELQTRLDMSLGNEVTDDAKRIIQNKSKHGRHRGQMMNRNEARLDSNVLNEYVSDMFRGMLINDLKSDFYGSISDVTQEWRDTLFEQLGASIGMPNNRAGILGIDYSDENVAKGKLASIYNFMYTSLFDTNAEPLNENSIARLGVEFGKLQTANLMSSQTYLRNTGQTVNKQIGNGFELWNMARQISNNPDVRYYAARSGVLSLESFLGDAVFTAASVDWFTGGTSGKLEWLATFITQGEAGVKNTFGKDLTAEDKKAADLYLYKLILKKDRGDISSKRFKNEVLKFGKNALEYVKKTRKRKQMLRNNVDDSALLLRMKKPEVKKQIAELKANLKDFIYFDPEFKPTNYKTDYRNMVNEVKALNFGLRMNAVNKIVQAKLNRYYSNPGKDGKAYGDDVFTLSGTEQQLRIEDYAMALLLAKKWGLINGWEDYTAGDAKNPMGDPIVVWLARSQVLFNDYLVHSAGQSEMFRGAAGKTIFKFQNFSFHQIRAEKEIMASYAASLDGTAMEKTLQVLKDVISSPINVGKDWLMYKMMKSEGIGRMGKARVPEQLNTGPEQGRPEADEAKRLWITRWAKTAAFEVTMNYFLLGQILIAYNSVYNIGRGVARGFGFQAAGPGKFSSYINEGSLSPLVSLIMRTLFLLIYAGANVEEEDLKRGRVLRLIQGVPMMPIGVSSMAQLYVAISNLGDTAKGNSSIWRATKYFNPVSVDNREFEEVQREAEKLKELLEAQ